MKQTVQVREENSAAPTRPQRKAPTCRVKVRLSREGKAAIEKAASKRGLTKSQFAEQAIRREVEKSGEGRIITTMTMTLGQFSGLVVMRNGQIKTGALVWTRNQFDEAMRAGRFLCTDIPYEREAASNKKRYERFLESLTTEEIHALRDSVPLYWIDDEPGIGDGFTVLISYRGELPDSAPADFGKSAAAMLADRISSLAMNIPQDWSEVAFIDFAGYVDRDCEERVIYKTPQGGLKAAKSSSEGGTVIENVTRPQVARWILECVIPEEFEPDFRGALPNVAANGGCELKRLTSREIEVQDARDLLENAVAMSAALLESVAAMLELQVTGDSRLEMFPSTVLGIRQLAEEQSSNLRCQFGVFVEAAAERKAAPQLGKS